jgi:hypothetical protein
MSDLHDDARRFDPTTYERARARLRDTPLALDATDLEQLGIVSLQLQATAIDAKRKARAPAATTTAAPPPAAPSRRVKAAELLAEAVIEILKRALAVRDQRIAELADRVLQLEATIAALQDVPR